jgi:acyl-CoA synthetase (AMP-forming)/AMP-acid ligase II
VYGGGPMYVDSLKKAMAAFGPIFVQLYGQGEAPMTITGLRRADHLDADDAMLGSIGYPRSGVDVAVLGADGSSAAIDEIGEIVCRGDVVMSGYWKNPDATAATLRDGWLHTGDMGSFDARGFLTLRDRSKDVVISGGSNIYPREVEEVLMSTPRCRRRASSARPTRSGARSWSRSSSGRRRRAYSTLICWSASPGSSARSAMSSSTRYRRTATARCSSGSCAPACNDGRSWRLGRGDRVGPAAVQRGGPLRDAIRAPSPDCSPG